MSGKAVILRMFVLGVWLFVCVEVGQAMPPLPRPSFDGNVTVEKAIKQRRTIRDFRATPISLAHLSQLLWAAQGITDPQGGRRAAPSGGARYPLDVYVAVGKNGVRSLPEGVYHYAPGAHAISLMAQGDLRNEIATASFWQRWMATAPVVFIITAEYRRITGKYGDRGVRYAMIETGHVGQNLFLQAEALGLGAGIVGAFHDAEVPKVIGASPEHEPLLIMPVGYKK